MNRTLHLACLIVTACSPPAGAIVLPGQDAGVAWVEAPRFTETGYAEGPALRVDGLPALSADGRVLLTYTEGDYLGTFEYVDVATGEVIASTPFPERVVEPYADELVWEIDGDARAALESRWSIDGYRALAALPALTGAAGDDAPARRGDERVVVESRVAWEAFEALDHAQTSEEAEPPSELDASITVIERATGRVLAAVDHGDVEALTAVHVAPDHSFVVVTESFCACECVTWSTMVRLDR